MIIGITGSFGSGKTTVSDIFRKNGFKVINADKLYHGIYTKDLKLKNKIKKEFGTFDRKKIKKIVFNDSKRLKKLNKITHPIILEEIRKKINNYKKLIPIKKIITNNKDKQNIKSKRNKSTNNKISKKNKKINLVLDIPLLFESKSTKIADKIIVVKCNNKEQMNRLLKKKKYSKKEINQIIKSQMPISEKIKKADFVVDNSKSMKNSENQVNKIIKKLYL